VQCLFAQLAAVAVDGTPEEDYYCRGNYSHYSCLRPKWKFPEFVDMFSFALVTALGAMLS
jgi:hypothetical protein